ncbi:hypothetical protein D9M70_456800 [compost metagenome]
MVAVKVIGFKPFFESRPHGFSKGLSGVHVGVAVLIDRNPFARCRVNFVVNIKSECFPRSFLHARRRPDYDNAALMLAFLVTVAQRNAGEVKHRKALFARRLPRTASTHLLVKNG